MTPTDLRASLAMLEISQVEAAATLGVDGSTVRRWISGKTEIPAPVGKLIKLMTLGLVAVQAVKNVKG